MWAEAPTGEALSRERVVQNGTWCVTVVVATRSLVQSEGSLFLRGLLVLRGSWSARAVRVQRSVVGQGCWCARLGGAR